MKKAEIIENLLYLKNAGETLQNELIAKKINNSLIEKCCKFYFPDTKERLNKLTKLQLLELTNITETQINKIKIALKIIKDITQKSVD